MSVRARTRAVAAPAEADTSRTTTSEATAIDTKTATPKPRRKPRRSPGRRNPALISYPFCVTGAHARSLFARKLRSTPQKVYLPSTVTCRRPVGQDHPMKTHARCQRSSAWRSSVLGWPCEVDVAPLRAGTATRLYWRGVRTGEVGSSGARSSPFFTRRTQ